MQTYSAKIQFDAPNDDAAYDMLCRFLYAYEEMREAGEDVGIVERAAVILPGTVVDDIELARDRAFGDAQAAREAAGRNPTPLPEGMPQV